MARLRSSKLLMSQTPAVTVQGGLDPAGKASSGTAPPHRMRTKPTPGVCTGAGGELQPRKKEPSAPVAGLRAVMFHRGAPAPQYDPRAPADSSVPGLRMSQPSSVSGSPLTLSMRASDEATFAVGPVFARSSPFTLRSSVSPVAHAGSVNEPVVVAAFVGQPIPSSQVPWTRC